MRTRVLLGASLMMAILGCSGKDDALPVSHGALSRDLSCRKCPIDLRHVVSIEDSTGGRLSEAMRLVEWGDGFLVGGVGEEDSQIARFDATGAFIRMIGSPGPGPGQFMGVKDVAPNYSEPGLTVLGYTVVQLDSALTPLRVVTDVSYARAFRIVRLDGGYAINSYVGKAPILIVNDTLDVIARVGQSSFDPDSNQFVLAPANDGSLWAARAMYGYEIRLVAKDASIVRTVRPKRPWFPEWTNDPDPTTQDFRRNALRPRVVGVRELPGDRLAVLVITADQDFKPTTEKAAGSNAPVAAEEYDEYLDSIIEVIDSRSGRLIASRRLDKVLSGFTPEGRVWSLAYEGQVAYADVFEPVLAP